jgi:hypothetical protein
MADQPGRNQPCPCGSGKKFKKCCCGKARREFAIEFATEEPPSGVTYNFDKNILEVHLENGTKVRPPIMFARTWYDRKSKKRKITSSVPNAAMLDIHMYLHKNFKELWVIDTNTGEIDGETFSVSTIVQCLTGRATIREDVSGTKLGMDFREFGNFFSRGRSPDNAEKVGIAGLIRFITRDPNYSPLDRFAIVTDHDLDKHVQYNARKIPIYGDFYLPSNFELLFATADSPNDNLLTKLINICDRDAKRNFQQMRQTKIATIGNAKVPIGQLPNYQPSNLAQPPL